MPFRSLAQKGLLYSQHPDVAKKFQKDTPSGTKLPRYAAKPAAPKFPKKPLGASALYGK